jgi:transcriptional repressor NF-X1
MIQQLATTYRIDTQMVDQEPHRRFICTTPCILSSVLISSHLFSVQLIRRIDTRVPSPLLSTSLTSAHSSLSSLNQVMDTRLPAAMRQPPSRSIASGTTGGSWTSVVARPRAAAPVRGNLSTREQKGPPESTRNISPVVGPVTTSGILAPPLMGEDIPDNWEDES